MAHYSALHYSRELSWMKALRHLVYHLQLEPMVFCYFDIQSDILSATRRPNVHKVRIWARMGAQMSSEGCVTCVPLLSFGVSVISLLAWHSALSTFGRVANPLAFQLPRLVCIITIYYSWHEVVNHSSQDLLAPLLREAGLQDVMNTCGWRRSQKVSRYNISLLCNHAIVSYSGNVKNTASGDRNWTELRVAYPHADAILFQSKTHPPAPL